MADEHDKPKGGLGGLWFVLGAVGLYFALQLWILPAAGVLFLGTYEEDLLEAPAASA